MLEYRRGGGEGGEGDGEQERKEEKGLLDTFCQGTASSPESFSLRTT